MSQTLTLARPYARAAYQVARETGSTGYWSQALAFAARVAADPKVDGLLGDPRLTRADAVALLSPIPFSRDSSSTLAVLMFTFAHTAPESSKPLNTKLFNNFIPVSCL